MIDVILSCDTRLPTVPSIESMIGDGVSLPKILEHIVKVAESAHPGAVCSVLLLDPTGKSLVKGASPSLPAIYNDAIEGFEIGPGIGCCGQAAFTGKRVVVEDVYIHPNWAPFRDLARVAGIRASASQPIFSSDGRRVLGTFAIYHLHPTVLSEAELDMMVDAAALARLAIEGVASRPPR